MPSEPTGPPNRAWRAGAGGAAPGGGKRQWQAKPAPAAAAAPAWSRPAKIRLALFALAAAVGLVIGLFYLLRMPRPACLLLAGASYDTNLAVPHNAYGWKGLRDLSAVAEPEGFVSSWFPWNRSGKLRRLQDAPLKVGENASWDDVLKALPRRVEEETVVLFVALHGGADPEKPYLLRDGPDPARDDRLSVRSLLKKLAESPALENKTKVLLLDATQVEANWLGGQLHNDFTRLLRNEVKAYDDLIVLCASDQGQRSWASEEWGQTVFAHYVVEGLKGAADLDGDMKVSAWELGQYVHDKVAAWAVANRNVRQEPVLLGSEQLARDTQLVQLSRRYQASGGGDGPDPEALARKLQPRWQEFQKLRDDPLSPAAYSPQVWRRYQDALLRYEQLLRAGDPAGKADELLAELRRLGERIEKARYPELAAASVSGTLAMPAALGLPAAADPEPRKLFDHLWSARKEEDRSKAWVQLAKWRAGKEATRAGPLLQAQLSRLALERALGEPDPGPAAATDPARDPLRRANQFVADLATHEFDRLPPAEAYFLTMLLRRDRPDLAAKAPNADLRLALEVRLLAEQAALALPKAAGTPARSEAVRPWIAADIKAADRSRRKGEDWLFGSQEAHWAEGRKLLAEARQGYVRARSRAVDVGEALNTRDRALADLPYLAAWAAGGREAGRRAEVQKLAREVGELAAALRARDAGGAPAGGADEAKALAGLTELAGRVGKDWTTLRRRFDTACSALRLKGDLHRQQLWHDIEHVLAVPLVRDVKTRMDLLRASRAISRALHGEAPQAGGGARPAGDEPLAPPRERGLAEADMALAAAGTPLLGTDQAVLTGKLENARAHDNWQLPLSEVGEAVGNHWRAARARVADDLRVSTDPRNRAVSGDLAKAAARLRTAVDYCRRLPGGAVPRERPDPFDPVEGLRRLRLHDLLVWQARRAARDHWWGDRSLGRDRSYYQPAARAFLEDALRLAKAGEGNANLNERRQALARAAEKELGVGEGRNPAGVRVTGQRRMPVTMEQSFPVSWQVKADPGVPGVDEGVPMVRLKLGPGLQSQDKSDLERQPLRAFRKKDFTLEAPVGASQDEAALRPRVRPTSARLAGVYRGQPLGEGSETAIDLYDTADIIAYRHQPPPGARVAFRMGENFHYGAVSIVLDMSGSMDRIVPGTKKKKIQLATDALGKVLETVPAGTYLSLVVFAHSKTPVTKDPPWKEAVRRTKIRWLRESRQWDRSQLKDLMASINKYYPGYNSPIAEAMVVAKEGGFPGGRYDGPKLILALTDGTDNLLAYDHFVSLDGKPTARRGTKSVSVFLRKEFEDSGIEVNVVCFAAGKEEGEARKQFGVFGKLEPQGRFLAVPRPRDLAEALEWALRPRIELRGNKAGAGGGVLKLALRATRPEENLEWSDKERVLPAGEYTARLRGTSPQPISLRDGESLIVTLKRDGRALVYERALFSEEARRKLVESGDLFPKPQHAQAWVADVLQNKKTGANRTITQLVTLENGAFRGGGGQLLEQRLPGFVWVEVTAKDGEVPEGLRWYANASYPAPAYSLLSAWRAAPDKETQVRAWWSRGEALPPSVWQSLTHPAGEPVSRLNGVEVPLEDGKAVLERVSAGERRKVMVSPGNGWPGKRGQRLCLVVRARYDKGHPIWVRIPELEALGQKWGEEHHYFTKANRYTAVFWGLSNFESTPFSLQVISLEAFKRRYPTPALEPPAATEGGTRLDEANRFHWARDE
jgi:hypothetical protein